MNIPLLLFTLYQDPVVVDQVLATFTDQVLTLAQVNKEAKGRGYLYPPDQRDYLQLRRQALADTLRVMLLSEGFYALARTKGLVGVLDNRIVAERRRQEEGAGSVAACFEVPMGGEEFGMAGRVNPGVIRSGDRLDLPYFVRGELWPAGFFHASPGRAYAGFYW